MNSKSALKFILVLLATAVLTFLAANPNGFYVPGLNKTIPSAYSTRFGIDVKGGVSVVFSAYQGYRPTEAEMQAVIKVLNSRLDGKQIYDRSIIPEKGLGRIIVEMPWKADEKEFNPQKAVEELGKTSMLKFVEVEIDTANNQIKTIGEPLVTGKEVELATPEVDREKGGMNVSLKFKPDGVQKFAEATRKLVGKPLGIFLDDQFISAPIVNTPITDGNASITFGNTSRNDTIAEAKNLADTINAGSLPFRLEAKKIDSITPLLGMNALNVSLYAGAVALVLVWVFMFLYYRLPGLLANIALLLHTVIQVLFITWAGITLTLPGIAGVILTIGIGVDANVIIFERIKEELRNGKTLRSAIDIGFKKAFSAILDANVTTMISGVVLMMFGSGAVKSFAITLILGVLLSFFTAITASRILLKSVSGLNLAKHRWLYGVPTKEV
jgi:preprotein translocase subunit SecD